MVMSYFCFYIKKTWNIIYEVDLDILKWIVTIDVPLFSPFLYPQNMITVGLYQVPVLVNKYL